jgi:predicted DCC family thiol-disulfide oxidoreductase YuxK
MSSTLTVWYNTKCPVCNAGIEWQHRRLVRAARAGVIEFRDINLEPDVLSRFGAGVEDVRRGCMPLMQRAACTSALIARSPFGFAPQATCGSAGCLAYR